MYNIKTATYNFKGSLNFEKSFLGDIFKYINYQYMKKQTRIPPL